MATQPIDRKKAKHARTTATRTVPALINRAYRNEAAEMAKVHWQYYDDSFFLFRPPRSHYY